jgi:hypothetical protein
MRPAGFRRDGSREMFRVRYQRRDDRGARRNPGVGLVAVVAFVGASLLIARVE